MNGISMDLMTPALLPCLPAARRAEDGYHPVFGNHHDITCQGEKLPLSTAPTFRLDSPISQSASKARLAPARCCRYSVGLPHLPFTRIANAPESVFPVLVIEFCA